MSKLKYQCLLALNCHNPDSTTTQFKSWVWHENNFTPPPPPTTRNSTSSIFQLLLTRFWPNFKGSFLGPFLTDANCHDNICPGNIWTRMPWPGSPIFFSRKFDLINLLPRLGHSSSINVSCAQILHKLSNTAQMSNMAQTEQHDTNWATHERGRHENKI